MPEHPEYQEYDYYSEELSAETKQGDDDDGEGDQD